MADAIQSTGTDTGEFVTAHTDGGALTIAPLIGTRQYREDQFHALLSPSATRSSGAGVRAIAEQPDPVRTCFERDRDRIRHSTQFRTLAGKTQVFLNSSAADERLRTRLTHSLEVSQIATAICQRLGLNWVLADAIALGHDCGHGPLGHAAEDALSPYLADGFDHAVFGADVALAPLNLTVEVLDGIRNHSWRRPNPMTPEGEVVSWADRIAYVCHDFDDACRSGIVSPEQLPAMVQDRLGTRQSTQISRLIDGVVDGAITNGVLSLSSDLAEALQQFRSFNYTHIYHRPAGAVAWDGAVKLLTDVMDYIIDTHGDDVSVVECVAMVAAMTDRQVFDIAVDSCGWDVAALPASLSDLAAPL